MPSDAPIELILCAYALGALLLVTLVLCLSTARSAREVRAIMRQRAGGELRIANGGRDG